MCTRIYLDHKRIKTFTTSEEKKWNSNYIGLMWNLPLRSPSLFSVNKSVGWSLSLCHSCKRWWVCEEISLIIHSVSGILFLFIFVLRTIVNLLRQLYIKVGYLHFAVFLLYCFFRSRKCFGLRYLLLLFRISYLTHVELIRGAFPVQRHTPPLELICFIYTFYFGYFLKRTRARMHANSKNCVLNILRNSKTKWNL